MARKAFPTHAEAQAIAAQNATAPAPVIPAVPTPSVSAVGSLLRKANNKATVKKAKTEHVKCDTVGTIVDKYVDLSKQLKQIETDLEQTGEAIAAQARTIYDGERQGYNYQTSIECPGVQTPGVLTIFPDRFCGIAIEMEGELRKLDPDYDKHFVEVRDVKVKKDAFADKTISDATIQKLINALGEEEFTRIFDIAVKIGTQKGLAEKWDMVPDAVKPFIKQVKPSVRILTDEGKVC